MVSVGNNGRVYYVKTYTLMVHAIDPGNSPLVSRPLFDVIWFSQFLQHLQIWHKIVSSYVLQSHLPKKRIMLEQDPKI
jgi:hypothetical protein